MTDAEAYELGRKAIYHATHRDAMSGGMVRSKFQVSFWFICLNRALLVACFFFHLILAYHMKSTGWVKISEEDVTELHYKYMKEKGQ